jgi:hypothetical protein
MGLLYVYVYEKLPFVLAGEFTAVNHFLQLDRYKKMHRTENVSNSRTKYDRVSSEMAGR